MLELTEEQARAAARSAEDPPTIVDPRTKTTYVLLRRELYERLTGADWSAEERDRLRSEAVAMLDNYGR